MAGFPKPQTLSVWGCTQEDDGIGGVIEGWGLLKTVKGYIDLFTGTDHNLIENAFVEQSTHVAVLSTYDGTITDKMRVSDEQKRMYDVTLADDPVGIGHHTELYLKYGGEKSG
jgi:hypothetical protein